jgi:phage gp45-like
MQQVGVASALPLNTDVMAIHVNGDNSNGCIVASNHQKFRPTGLKTGETVIYDCGSTQQSILLKADGSIVITGAHQVLISCDTEVIITAPKVHIKGDLEVEGKITAGFGTSDSVTLQGHRHGLGTAVAGTSVPSPGT